MGWILLEGGDEFGGSMAVPDRRAMELAGGLSARVRVIPAAAAPDRNHERAGRNGFNWFQSLGARDVAALPLIDRASADDPTVAAQLQTARLIYLLGGFTHYLGQVLRGSASAAAMRAAFDAGAVIAGSSAGAMVLCEHYYDPPGQRLHPGLEYVPNACVIPHHNTFGQDWAGRLARLLPRGVLIGIDEQTGMLNDGEAGAWRVYGRGGVTVYWQGEVRHYGPGSAFSLPGLSA